MSQPILVVIIVLALVAAAALIIRSHKGSLKNLGADLKAHVSQVSAGAETRLVRLIARTPAEPSKVAAPATAAKAIPVVGTTAEPAPAAPAVSAAVEPPPATVAPAAPPAVPAPSAEGSGTEHTLNAGVVAEHARNQYLSLDFTNKLPAGEVQLADAEYIVKMGPPFRAALGTLPNVQLQFAILSGTQAAINLAMDHALQDIARTLKSDPATYAGPLKARYAALVEGVHSGAIKPVSLYSDTGAAS